MLGHTLSTNSILKSYYVRKCSIIWWYVLPCAIPANDAFIIFLVRGQIGFWIMRFDCGARTSTQPWPVFILKCNLLVSMTKCPWNRTIPREIFMPKISAYQYFSYATNYMKLTYCNCERIHPGRYPRQYRSLRPVILSAFRNVIETNVYAPKRESGTDKCLEDPRE